MHTQRSNNVAKDIWCWSPWLIKERFRSINFIKKLNCPFYLIHGRNDKVIKPHHSEDLYARAVKCGKEELWGITIRAEMDHNNFSFTIDISEPMKEFMKGSNFINDLEMKISMNVNQDDPEELRLWKLKDFKDLGKTPPEYEEKALKDKYLEKRNKSCCIIF